MSSPEIDLEIYECQSCESVRLSDGDPTCCDGPMDRLNATVPTEPPVLEELMRDVFDISATELDVCRQVMLEGETTIDDLVEAVDRDRSVVSRHLNHLVDLGVVGKRSQVLPEGGRVNVYAPQSERIVRRQLVVGLYGWFLEGEALLEEVSEEKIARMAEGTDDRRGTGRSLVDTILSRDPSE